MIDLVSLRGFKCFKDKVVVPLSPITLMYGKNGRGKSSVSQALLLIAQSMKKNNDLSQLVINDGFVSLGSFCDLLSKEDESELFEIEIHSLNNETLNVTFSSADTYPHIGFLQSLLVNGKNIFEEKGTFNSNPNTIVVECSNQVADSNPSIGVTSDITTLQNLKDIIYVSANRIGPINSVKNEYEKGDVFFNPMGSNVINIIAAQNEKFLDEIQQSLSFILSGASINCSIIGDSIELGLNSVNDGNCFKPINVGYGYSYVLPVIVSVLIAKKDNIVIIENPEAHLHPGAQSRLTEFLVKKAKNIGFQLIIESHSDHVINGVRISAKKSIIHPSDCIIDYFAHDENSSTPSVTPITCDKNGTLSEYPIDFMDEWTAQMLELV